MRKPPRLLPLSICIALALPAHAQDDGEDWGLCRVTDVVPAFDDAPTPPDGAGTPEARAQAPTDIEGGSLERASDDENIIVQDNVRLSRGDQFLGTDRLLYNADTGRYTAEGSIRYQDAGMRIVAERAEGDQNADTHRIEDLQYQLTERRGNGGADRIELRGRYGSLVGSTYTTCDPSEPGWQLRAGRIDIDTEEGMGVARNAILRIGKVPVLYVPWFKFPVDDRRRTGLLYPSISLSGRNGLDWKQPVYLNLAPNYDATLTPRLMTDRGVQLGGEFRWLYEKGRGTFFGEWMADDELPGREPDRYLRSMGELPEERGLFRLTSSHNFNRTWYARANLGWVSDPHYLEDFSNSLYAVSQYSLTSSAGLYGRGRYWDAGLMADRQQLADYTLTERQLRYDRLPRAYLNWAQPVGRWFELGLNGEAVRFQHSVRNEASRLDVKPYVAMPLEGDSWFVTPKLAWRYTAYQLDDTLTAALGDESPTRSLPISSVDAGMFFERETSVFGDRYLQTLEPRLYYLNVPYRDQGGLPRFDTQPMTFSWGQLFRDNRYTGPDRQIDANQLTTALTTRLISEDDGRERLAASIGQIQYFEDSLVVVPGETPVEKGKSAWVADLGVSPTDRLTINAAYQWDPKFRQEDLASIRARYLVGDYGVINVGYRYRRDLVDQVDFAFLYPINRNWSVVGRYYYSFEDKKLLESIAGIQWESCCLAARLVARRYIRDRDGDLDDSLRLEIELKGLGSAGQKTEGVLRRAILGYDRDDLYLVPPSSLPTGNVEHTPDPIL